MRILHTSDWHLGHLLKEMDRTYEHWVFLDWLLDLLATREVDALLIAGDIFDTANPSAASQEQWYGFLAGALRRRPALQVVAIAGNHDSGARLEAPDHLLRQFRIRVVGSLPRTSAGAFDPAALLVPLLDADGRPAATVIAMPFLRPGDLPFAEGEDPLVEGVRALYAQALEAALRLGAPVMAMGHCYLVDGQVSELSERKVLGGNQHALPGGIFPGELAYVALGHLHLPQARAEGRIRYSGSPIPLSMGERHYRHSVTLLELDPDGTLRQEQVPVPRTVAMVRIPDAGHLPTEDLLLALATLEPPEGGELPPGRRPFLEVGVRLEKPEPALRPRIEAALEGRGHRLVRIDPLFTGTGQVPGDGENPQGLGEFSPEQIFREKWSERYEGEPGPEVLAAFHELVDQVGQAGGR